MLSGLQKLPILFISDSIKNLSLTALNRIYEAVILCQDLDSESEELLTRLLTHERTNVTLHLTSGRSRSPLNVRLSSLRSCLVLTSPRVDTFMVSGEIPRSEAMMMAEYPATIMSQSYFNPDFLENRVQQYTSNVIQTYWRKILDVGFHESRPISIDANNIAIRNVMGGYMLMPETHYLR